MQMQTSSAYQLPLESGQVFFPSRLEWLCQPEQIEYTLLLLFYLNSWKKADQRLFYVDRQGLQEVQTLVLARAIGTGLVRAIGYVDGTGHFPGELLLESAARSAARNVLITVRDLCNPDTWPPFPSDGNETYKCFIRPLYQSISGQDCKLVADALGLLRFEQIRDYIEMHLQQLVAQAKLTRQPVASGDLARLCIAPGDLLHMRDKRLYFLDSYEAWEDLEICDLRKLDPEGFSKIVLQYASSTAEYIFHLPFAHAADCVAAEHLHRLQQRPTCSQERGTMLGQVVDEAAGLEHPVREILQDLGVDIALVCPHRLVEREASLAHPALRDLFWPTHGPDYDDWDDDSWPGGE